MSEKRFEVVMAALLHDIGKFIQRGKGMYEDHESFSKEFVLNSFPALTDTQRTTIADLVYAHHQKSLENPELTEFLEIVKKSDHLSAEHDRKEEIEERNVRTTPLRSVFSELHRNEGVEVPIKNLPPVAVSEEKIWETRKVTISGEDYRRLYGGFLEDIRKVGENKSGRELLDSLNYVLMKWTRFVPSAVYMSVPDIPLYDHLKTTAAIALAFLEGEKEKPFLLIGGDVSGIQRFIFYNRTGENVDEKATKRIRGRSFLINLIVDATTKYILKEMDLYEVNVLWATGGVFLILAPNNQSNRQKLEEIKSRVNLYLHRTFKRLSLVMVGMEADVDDMKNFHTTHEKLIEMIDDAKQQKYAPIWNSIEFVGERRGAKICPSCGMPLEESDKDRCQVCLKEEDLGGSIARAEPGSRLVRWCCEDVPDADWVFDFGRLKVAYRIYQRGEMPASVPGDIFTINNVDFLTSNKNMNGYKLFGTYLPAVNGKALSINDMLRVPGGTGSREFAPLALFKADVDNLGLLFSEGLKEKERSISRLTFLSFLLDLYFSFRIRDLAKNHGVYVVFSGGDDLVATGRYDKIFYFARDVNRTFKEWTENPFIHLSGGIVLSHPKFPLRKLVNYGEEALECSKSFKPERVHYLLQKDAITAFDVTVPWSLFEKQLEFANVLLEKHSNRNISAGFSYFLLFLKKYSWEEGKSLKKGVPMLLRDPHLYYYLARNWRGDKEERDRFIDTIKKHWNGIEIGNTFCILERRFKETKGGERSV